jgi:site-specific recombinase XerD
MKDKSYRATPVGGEIGRFLRSLRWSEKKENTLLLYELVLSRLAIDFAHYQTLDEFDHDDIIGFLDEHWGEAAPATRANRTAVLKSFFQWSVGEGRCKSNPTETIKAPKVSRSSERHAYKPDVIHGLVVAQESVRDQIALQLLGRLGLRKNELRLLRLEDFDLVGNTILVHGKGDKDVVLPIGFEQLRTDIAFYLAGRNLGEYLLYPRTLTHQPMDAASVHRWFKACLRRAGLPETMKIHELRHSAADNLWRATGNLILAQQLLRHESPATTAVYLHPNRDDLAAALRALGEVEK